MNINDFNIGIEIEYTQARTRQVANAIKRAGLACELTPYGRCHANHNGWIVTTDQTVSRNISYATGEADGGEVVSPKLKYRDAIEQVTTVCEAMNAISDVSVNRNCGLHISVSWPNMTAKQVKNIVARYRKYEGEIDAFMPPSRRANRNRWCGSLNASWVSRVVNGRQERLTQLREGGKFVKLNLTNLDNGPRSRLEFRHHSGTTDATKIVNWIRFVCQFIKSAQMQDTLQTRYRASKPAWFADIREQLEGAGIKTKWSKALAENGANGMTFHTVDGRLLASKTFLEMQALYQHGANSKGRGAQLNDDFVQFAQNLMAQAGTNMEADTGIYHGLQAEVREYFRSRTQHFANPYNQ